MLTFSTSCLDRGRHRGSKECEKSDEEKEEGGTVQVTWPMAMLWDFFDGDFPHAAPPTSLVMHLDFLSDRYLQENTDYQDKVRFLFQASTVNLKS